MLARDAKGGRDEKDIEEAEHLLGGPPANNRPPASAWPSTEVRGPAMRLRFKALLAVVVIVGLVYVQRSTFGRSSASYAFESRWHAHELPDQLRMSDGSIPPKQPYEDLRSLSNPTLDRIVQRIEGLSAHDARLLQVIKQEAPALPDNVADHCGDIIARQAVNQQKQDARKIVFWQELKDLGLADRSKGVITSFMIAYALDLPFYIHWDGDEMLPAETVWESPYLNWAWPQPVIYDESIPQTSTFISFAGWEGTEQENAYWNITTREEMMAKAAPASVNRWRGNVGHAAGAFKHPSSFLGKALTERGITMESVYGCAYSYLFQPIRATRLAMADYLAVLSHPAVFSVAIQARLGDDALLAGDLHNTMDPKYPLHYFQCAMAAVQRLVKPEQHKIVVFYVASDNPSFRNLALELSADPERLRDLLQWDLQLPPPLLLLGPSVPAHISVGSDMDPNNATERPIMQHNIQYAIFENYLMDVADARIITSKSGYGLISALRTWTFGARESTWQVHRPRVGELNEPKLAIYDAATAMHAVGTKTGAWCKDGISKYDDIMFTWGFF